MGFADLLALADVSARGQLGRTVTYTPAVGAAVDVIGIFDQAYVKADLGNPGVSTSGPAVFLTLDDLPSDPKTDTAATVTVGGVAYLPHAVEPDGLGGTLLHLHEVI